VSTTKWNKLIDWLRRRERRACSWTNLRDTTFFFSVCGPASCAPRHFERHWNTKYQRNELDTRHAVVWCNLTQAKPRSAIHKIGTRLKTVAQHNAPRHRTSGSVLISNIANQQRKTKDAIDDGLTGGPHDAPKLCARGVATDACSRDSGFY